MKDKSSTSETLPGIARYLRMAILRATTAAGSGHPTSSLSATDLMTALLFGGVFRADLNRPRYPNNDRLIFSKGHAAPLLYALSAAAGKIPMRNLLRLRKQGSILEGHPMPVYPYCDVPTGSLGQGLSIGVGMALAGRMRNLPFRTYVLLGDSEMAEGSVWEALQLAGHERLATLTAILDVNRLGQSGPTMLGHHVEVYAKRVASFGWKTVTVNGHDLKAVLRAYRTALQTRNKPTMVIARTVKGKGVSFLENKGGWHGKALTEPELRRALKEIGPVPSRVRGEVTAPERVGIPRPSVKVASMFRYPAKKPVAPREAFGNALVRLAPAWPQLVVLDAEVKNSTMTEAFGQRFPRRFLESYIAEQNMIGIATGLAARDLLPVSATFAAFLTRCHDQLRMAHYAGAHQIIAGTHAGVHIGEDGPSQMGLEDIAMFRSLQNCTVLYPADAVATERCTELSLSAKGLAYLRLTRAKLPVVYPSSAVFHIGGSHTLLSSPNDRATIVAAGVTLHEALKAATALANRKIPVRVIDCYSIAPIDAVTLKRAARETGRMLTVEDHYLAGGIGEAVQSVLGPLAGAVRSLGVTKVPHSATPEQQLAVQGIDAGSIVKAVLAMV